MNKYSKEPCEYHIKQAYMTEHLPAAACWPGILQIRCIFSNSGHPRMEKWHNWLLSVSNRGKGNGMKSASCRFYAPGLAPQLVVSTFFLRPAVCFECRLHTHTCSFVFAVQTVLQESVSVYCLSVPLCASWCLPLQNNGLAWEKHEHGRSDPICFFFPSPATFCNFDCIS